jgi:hypothetical protein
MLLTQNIQSCIYDLLTHFGVFSTSHIRGSEVQNNNFTRFINAMLLVSISYPHRQKYAGFF